MDAELPLVFERCRKELLGYLLRLVVRPQLAEELAQATYLRCHEAAQRLPTEEEGVRAWIFKVATHLAIDELRRHHHWRETVLLDLREAVSGDPRMVAASKEMASTPETRAIAREHLVTCFGCTLRNLPEHRAAALLLKEVHGFSLAEVAAILEAGEGQVKNWLQEARREMEQRYGTTCALVAKNGVCHQCVELDGFFRAGQGRPLPEDTSAHLDHRLQLLREWRERPPGPWHRMILELIDELR